MDALPIEATIEDRSGAKLKVLLTSTEDCVLLAVELGQWERVENAENVLEPLPYHVELMDYLKSQERDLWSWFASARAQSDYTERLRMDLLKSTYRLDADGHPDLIAAVEAVTRKLDLDIPVTLYQEHNNPHSNEALYFIPSEGHVVFSGPILTLLNAEHELAHYRLWQCDAGEFHISDRLIQVVAIDPRAAESHEQTARRFQLYTEIFADRGALRVTPGSMAWIRLLKAP